MTRKNLVLLATLLMLSGMALGQTPGEDASEVRPGLVPGNPLYAVEGFVESIEVKMAGIIGGPDLKSKAIANNAEERLAEARHLVDKNKTEQAGKAMQKYLEGINQSRNIARESENSKLEEQIQNVSNRNKKALEEVEKKVPPQAKEAIRKAQEKSNKNSQRIGEKPENKSEIPEKAGKGLNKSNNVNTGKKDGLPNNSKSKPELENKNNISDVKPRSENTKDDLTNKTSPVNGSREKQADETSKESESVVNKTQENRKDTKVGENSDLNDSGVTEGSGSVSDLNGSGNDSRDLVG